MYYFERFSEFLNVIFMLFCDQNIVPRNKCISYFTIKKRNNDSIYRSFILPYPLLHKKRDQLHTLNSTAGF